MPWTYRTSIKRWLRFSVAVAVLISPLHLRHNVWSCGVTGIARSPIIHSCSDTSPSTADSLRRLFDIAPDLLKNGRDSVLQDNGST